MFHKVNFLRIIAHSADVAEKCPGSNCHIFTAIGNLLAKFLHTQVVFGRKIRALDIKAVGDFIKFIDDLVQIFYQIENVCPQVGNQVLFIQAAFDVTAEDVRVVLDLFNLLVEFLIFFAALDRKSVV